MKYKNFTTPYIDDFEIKKIADNFRKKVWGAKIPVDIESIIEIKLKIKIIPVPGMLRLCNVDSQISSDLNSILVDQDIYMFNETNRICFSLAHELGHYVLHKELFSGLHIKNVDDARSFIDDIPQKQYSFLETQANKFAGFFLVPRETLSEKRNEIVKKHKLENIDREMVDSYIADSIAKIFEISSSVAGIALKDLDKFERR